MFSSHYNPTGHYLNSEYRLPFPDGDFGVVFLCSVFTHMLPDGVANYIREISRVLKRGGRCVSSFFLLNQRVIITYQGGWQQPRIRASIKLVSRDRSRQSK